MNTLREVRMSFESLGGDDLGAMLDNVTLSLVPVFQTTLLLALAAPWPRS